MRRALLTAAVLALCAAGCSSTAPLDTADDVAETTATTDAPATTTTTQGPATTTTTVGSTTPVTSFDDWLDQVCETHITGNGLTLAGIEPWWHLTTAGTHVSCVITTDHGDGQWTVRVVVDETEPWTNDRMANAVDPEWWPVELQQQLTDTDGIWVEPPAPERCEERSGGTICFSAEPADKSHAHTYIICGGVRVESDRYVDPDTPDDEFEQWNADQLYSTFAAINADLIPRLCPNGTAA